MEFSDITFYKLNRLYFNLSSNVCLEVVRYEVERIVDHIVDYDVQKSSFFFLFANPISWFFFLKIDTKCSFWNKLGGEGED